MRSQSASRANIGRPPKKPSSNNNKKTNNNINNVSHTNNNISSSNNNRDRGNNNNIGDYENVPPSPMPSTTKPNTRNGSKPDKWAEFPSSKRKVPGYQQPTVSSSKKVSSEATNSPISRRRTNNNVAQSAQNASKLAQCPLCKKFMPKTVIELHASGCQGNEKPDLEDNRRKRQNNIR